MVQEKSDDNDGVVRGRAARIVAALQPGCEEMEKEWGNEGEIEVEWGNEDEMERE